jgi:hypothetical protein
MESPPVRKCEVQSKKTESVPPKQISTKPLACVHIRNLSDAGRLCRIQFLTHVEGGIHAASPRRKRLRAAAVR